MLWCNRTKLLSLCWSTIDTMSEILPCGVTTLFGISLETNIQNSPDLGCLLLRLHLMGSSFAINTVLLVHSWKLWRHFQMHGKKIKGKKRKVRKITGCEGSLTCQGAVCYYYIETCGCYFNNINLFTWSQSCRAMLSQYHLCLAQDANH